MPYTRRDGDNVRWVKSVSGKRKIAICTTFEPHAEAHARLIAAAPETKQQRDDLLAALERIKSECFEAMEGAGLPEFENYGCWLTIADQAIAKTKK